MMMKSNTAWIISLIVFVLHFLPYILFPGDAYIRIHDTLDGEWVWLHILNETHTAFNFNSDTVVQPIMNGIPRSSMPTGLSATMLLVTIFGTYWAYVINYGIIHLVAFISMYTFLKWYWQQHKNQELTDAILSTIIYISLIFSLIPVYTPFGLTVAAQPFLLLILIKLINNKAGFIHFAFLFIFPFYSSFVWIGIPLIMIMGTIWMIRTFKTKKIQWQFLFGTMVITCMYALVNYNIVQLTLYPPDGFISHRTAYQSYLFMPPTLSWSFGDFMQHFFTIHHHVGTMVTLPIILAGIIIYQSSQKNLKQLFIIILLIVFFQSTYNFFEYYIAPYIGIIKSFRLSRFNILLPLIWMLILFIIGKEWLNQPWLRKSIQFVFISIVFTTALGNDEILHNYRRVFGAYHFPTYKEYFATNELTNIRTYLKDDPSSYRVACIGMNPAILQYNGFYTLDGLQSIYNLNYKIKFRKIFERELEKDERIRNYFDGWGNRCYLFSAEVGHEWDAFLPDRNTERIIHLELNSEAFKALGGKYLFSAFEIENLTGFKKVLKSEGGNSWWNFHVYEVKNE